MWAVKSTFAVALLLAAAAQPLPEDDGSDLGARERPLQRATSYVDALIPLEFQVGPSLQ